MNINQEIQKATDAFIEEKLPAMVSTKVEKMVDGILDDIFRSYSDTAKNIKRKIEEGLDINLQEFGLVDYNALISKAIAKRLDTLVSEEAIKPVMAVVDDIVGFVSKKEIKLSEIHEMVIQVAKDGYSDEQSGEISFFVEENDRYDWLTVTIDEEKKKKEDCAISFIISTTGSRAHLIFSFHAGDYKHKKSEITPARMVMLRNIELKIFRLYAAGVKVIVDETYFDNEWNKFHD